VTKISTPMLAGGIGLSGWKRSRRADQG